MMTDEGLCCPIRHTYLLLGLEDGRILFMDPVIRGQKYMEFKATKDAVSWVKKTSSFYGSKIYILHFPCNSIYFVLSHSLGRSLGHHR